MIKKWISQYYNAGIYTYKDIDCFIVSGYLSEKDGQEIKCGKMFYDDKEVLI